MRESPVSVSPVPTEQQPLNEYEQLKEAWLFNWTTLAPFPYFRKLAWVGFWGWLLAAPIVAASFSPRQYPWQFGLWTTGGGLFLVTLIVVRLYLGWSYIRDRLNKETVFYEESGWYDGQKWRKPPEVLTRDRLVASYQVEPILNRIQFTLAILAALAGLCSFICFFFT